MKQSISFSQFTDAFNACRPDNFSYTGLRALYDYFTELEEDCGIEIEFDVIAICCEYSEYESIEEAREYYNLDMGNDEEILDHFRDHTQVIKFNGGLILADY